MDDPTAMGLLQQLRNYKFVALLCLMTDVLGVVNHLSRIFQYRSMSFHTIKPQVILVQICNTVQY